GLRELRERVGQPSYAEVARRIAARRVDNGVEEFAAMPARTTVYDAFRLGRSRMDPVLIRDIARARGDSREDSTSCNLRVPRAASAIGLWAGIVGDAPVPPPAPEPEAPRSEAEGWTTRTQLVMVALCVVLKLVGPGIVADFHVPLDLDM